MSVIKSKFYLSKRELTAAEYVKKREEESGNVTYIYDEKHVEKRNKDKAKKIDSLVKSISTLRTQVKKDIDHEDIKVAIPALAVALIDDTYERVGNRYSAKDMKHYGVSTWLKKHITFSGSKAIIKYVGKSGVNQKKEVNDSKIVSALKALTKDKNDSDPVFQMDDYVLNDNLVNKYLKQYSITAKDLRGMHANREVRENLKRIKKTPPKDQKEKEKQRKEEFKEALEEAAKEVGHEANTLKNQYLVPGFEEKYISTGNIMGKASSVFNIYKYASSKYVISVNPTETQLDFFIRSQNHHLYDWEDYQSKIEESCHKRGVKEAFQFAITHVKKHLKGEVKEVLDIPYAMLFVEADQDTIKDVSELPEVTSITKLDDESQEGLIDPHQAALSIRDKKKSLAEWNRQAWVNIETGEAIEVPTGSNHYDILNKYPEKFFTPEELNRYHSEFNSSIPRYSSPTEGQELDEAVRSRWFLVSAFKDAISLKLPNQKAIHTAQLYLMSKNIPDGKLNITLGNDYVKTNVKEFLSLDKWHQIPKLEAQIKLAGLIKLPPEFDNMWDILKRMYARRVMSYVEQPHFSDKQVGEIKQYLQDLIDRLFHIDFDDSDEQIFLDHKLDQPIEMYFVDSETKRYITKSFYINEYQEHYTLTGDKVDSKGNLRYMIDVLMSNAEKAKDLIKATPDETIVESAILKRKVEKDAGGSGISSLGHSFPVEITPEDWKIYKINPEIAPKIIHLAISNEVRDKKGKSYALGVWSPNKYTITVYIQENQLKPNDMGDYEKFLNDINDTLTHEVRHMMQTLMSWSSQAKPEAAGLPKSRTRGHDPSGYLEHLNKEIDDLFEQDKQNRAEYNNIKNQMRSADPDELTDDQAKWLKWNESTTALKIGDTTREIKIKLKEREDLQLRHELRDIEFHTNLGDEISRFINEIKPFVPKKDLNNAIKARVGLTKYINKHVDVGHTPFFFYLKQFYSRKWRQAVKEFASQVTSTQYCKDSQDMPFPKEYEKALTTGEKNMTIRILDEIGKYEKGNTYQATDYEGNSLNVLIEIIDIIKYKFKDLPKIKELKELEPNDEVEIIKFKIKE